MLDSFDNIKIGTRLLVRNDLLHHEDYEDYFVTDDMYDMRGQVVTVTGIDSDCIHVECKSTVKDSDYGWTPEMFECIVDDDVSLLDMLKEECV